MRRRVLQTLAVTGLTAAVSAVGAYAAFTATTTNSGNSFASGTVAIGDNDAGTAMLSLAAAKPGDADTSCITVTYTGSLASTVRLYASTTGSLAPYLTLTVTRGTDPSPSFDSCASFTAEGTNYVGAGPGVVYSGPLSAFPATYDLGLVDPTSGSPESWTTSEAHTYLFAISLVNDNAAQGLSSTASFTWEARNQ